MWHFARREGSTAGESDLHVMGKQAVHQAARSLGWRAHVEHRGPQGLWIADVLTVDGDGRRIAWEVQLAQQSEQEYLRRTQRYAEDGIETVWIGPWASGKNGIRAGLLGLPMEEDLERMLDTIVITMRFLERSGAVRMVPQELMQVIHVSCWRCGLEFAARPISSRSSSKAAFSSEEIEMMRQAGGRPGAGVRRVDPPGGAATEMWCCPRCDAGHHDGVLSAKTPRTIGVRRSPRGQDGVRWISRALAEEALLGS